MIFTTEIINRLNDERLSKVNPELAVKCRQLIELANQNGHILLVTQGFRSMTEQTKLYNQGRTTRGKIVTNAKAGQSKHNFGKAVDFAFIVNGEVSWNESLYKLIGVWAKTVGLIWGGNFKSINDKPHVEI